MRRCFELGWLAFRAYDSVPVLFVPFAFSPPSGLSAGNIMMLMMTMFPLLISLLGDTVEEYGYSKDQPG